MFLTQFGEAGIEGTVVLLLTGSGLKDAASASCAAAAKSNASGPAFTPGPASPVVAVARLVAAAVQDGARIVTHAAIDGEGSSRVAEIHGNCHKMS